MEVAGVVLGAIPIAIAALECYVASDSLFSNVFSRQTHVRSLARSLRGYRMEYRTSLELLLRRIGVYDPTEHTHEDISALLQDPLTSTRLKDYLGDEKFDVYQDAIMEAQEAIYKVVKNIKGLVPKEAKSEAVPALTATLSKSETDIRVQLSAGFRLHMNSVSIDKQIARLEKANNIMRHMQNMQKELQEVVVPQLSGSLRRSSQVLLRLRKNAVRVYSALSSCWSHNSPPCDIRVYLYHRVPGSSTRRPVKQDNTFKLLFGMEQDGSNDEPRWLESSVGSLESDYCTMCHTVGQSQDRGSRSGRIDLPKVTFSPDIQTAKQPATLMLVENLHYSVKSLVGGSLGLQICQHQRLYQESNAKGDQCGQVSMTLEDLILNRTGRPDLFYPRPKILLELNLASSLLELYQTPWLNEAWHRSMVRFVASTTPTMQIFDFDHPVVQQQFPKRPPITSNCGTSMTTQDALFELGILLLEIELETTFEQFCKSHGHELKDQGDRIGMAMVWLKEAERKLLPDHYMVIERCVKGLFHSLHKDNSLDDPELHMELLSGIIEPLHSLYERR